jgi:hypothetical protein
MSNCYVCKNNLNNNDLNDCCDVCYENNICSNCYNIYSNGYVWMCKDCEIIIDNMRSPYII